MLESHKALYTYFAIAVIGIFITVSLLIKLAPLTVSHAIYYCQQIITQTVLSLPHSLPVIIVFGFVFILQSGCVLLGFQIFKTKQFVGKLLRKKVQTPQGVLRTAQELQLSDIIYVIDIQEIMSFSYGFYRSRICLSLGAIDSLNNQELRAVLLHESSHIKNHDPLKIILTQVISLMFFFLPILKDFQRYYILAKEVDADRLVIATDGHADDLRSALSKLLVHTTPTTISVAPFVQKAMLEERIMLLAGLITKVPLRVSSINASISIIVIVLSLVFLATPLYAMEISPNYHSYLVCPGDKCAAYCVEII